MSEIIPNEEQDIPTTQDTGNGNPPPKLPVQDPDQPTDSLDTGNGNPPPKNQA